jgi:SAM-dependent methyltransferase
MEGIRKPLQGVGNIVRFNWHFYALSIGIVAFLVFLDRFLPEKYQTYNHLLCFLIGTTTLISLLVSWYIYDLSELYKLTWLSDLNLNYNGKIININAGFDETSLLLKNKFPLSDLVVFDFYDPQKHTEISIKRARKAYPSYPDTQSITTANIPLKNESVDVIFATLAAHEIRDDAERVVFFNELQRILKPTGQIIVTEHLRDLPNFLAYNIGFLHFLSLSSWLKTFKSTSLNIVNTKKITPFITVFILKKHGISS